MSNEIIKPSNINLVASIVCYDTRILLKFNRSCLKQDEVTFTTIPLVNFYIVYQKKLRPFDLGTKFTIGNCLFGTFRLTKNDDKDKYGYSGYGIGFDTCSSFLLNDDGGFGENIINFGVENSSSIHVNNTKKDILILWKGPVDRLADATVIVELNKKKLSRRYNVSIQSKKL